MPSAPEGKIRLARRAVFLWLAAILWLSGARILRAADTARPDEKQTASGPQQTCQTFRVREQDQVWLISTRHLGCSLGVQPTYQLWQYEKGRWKPKTEADFFADDRADLITPMFVHGNRITADEASSYGLTYYFELIGKLDTEPPARFVIWSWPSDQIRGPLNDVRTKAARSDYEAWNLGSFVARMKPEVRVGILGYSYGARILSGSMHLIGGGSIFGYSLPPGERPKFRGAMWAAAEHNTWYLPRQFHSAALAAAEAWFVTVNYCDPALARYDRLDPCGNPPAVGYAGIYGRNLLPPDVNARVEEVNVTNIVGGSHDWRQYLYSRYIQDRTRDYLMWHDLAPGFLKASASSTATQAD